MEFSKSKFLDSIKKDLGNDSVIGFDPKFNISEWYSTGSAMLDMQLNGGRLDIGGVPSGKLTVFAGYESCGKTYFALQVAKDFLNKNKENGFLVFFDSERNVSTDTFLNAGFDSDNINRTAIVPVDTLERYRTNMILFYQYAKDNDVKLMLILDSVGGLVPQKVIDEATAKPDKNGIAEVKSAMGRPQQITKEFTKLTIHNCAKNNSPAIFISHVYGDTNAPNPKYAGTIISGGKGINYFNSNTVEFTRKKAKTDDNKINSDRIGNINGILVKSKLRKSRLAREETVVHSFIHFNFGVIKYYGFITLLEESGLITKIGTKYQLEKDGKKYWAKELLNDSSLIEPLLPELQKWTIHNFGLGKMSLNVSDEEIKLNAANLDYIGSGIDEELLITDEIGNTSESELLIAEEISTTSKNEE